HPDERITTATPESRLLFETRTKATAVAASEGLPVKAVDQILASLFEGAVHESPFEVRAATLRRYWREIDRLHEVQSPNDPPLWGLVEQSGWEQLPIGRPAGSYRSPHSPGLLADVER